MPKGTSASGAATTPVILWPGKPRDWAAGGRVGVVVDLWTLPFFLTTLDEINLKNLTHTGNRLRRAPPMLLDSLRQASRCLPPTLKGARVTITYPNRRGYFFWSRTAASPILYDFQRTA